MAVFNSLKTWFKIHFLVDLIFAIPLMFAPTQTLAFFNLPNEPVMARLVAAALIGIGTISLLVKNQTQEVFKSLLTLKQIWSASAILGLLLAVKQYPSLWLFIIIFTLFFSLWTYYRNQLKSS